MTEKAAEATRSKAESSSARISDSVSAMSEALTRENGIGLPAYGKTLLDGWVKAGQVWSDSLQSISRSAIDIGEHQLLRTSECLRGLGSCESVPDLLDRQQDFVSRSTAAYFEETRILAESVARAAQESWLPVADGLRTALEQSARRTE